MTQAENAETPMTQDWRSWYAAAFRVKDKIGEHRIGLIAAGIAFYGLLALFPAITATIALTGLLFAPSDLVAQVESFAGLVPQAVIDIVSDQATEVAGSQGSGLGIAAVIGLLFALWSASKGMSSLIEGLNVAYHEREDRGFIMLKVWTLALTLFLIFGLILGLGAMIIWPAVVAIFDFGPIYEALMTVGLWLGLIALTIGGLAVLFHFGPSRRAARWSWTMPGAIAACLLWIVASAGFSIYVSKFATYNETFGALSGVIVLLMWFWVSAFIVLAGAELNAELERETADDTTIGKARPAGERGAEVADEVVSSKTSRG